MTFALPGWWRKSFLRVEFRVALLASLGFVIWVQFWGHQELDSALRDHRTDLYLALATVCGSLFGFVLAAAAIVLGYARDPALALVRASDYYPQLWDVFSAAIRALGAATILSLIALVVDRGSHPEEWALYLVFASTLLAALRLARTVWVLENVIEIATAKTTDS